MREEDFFFAHEKAKHRILGVALQQLAGQSEHAGAWRGPSRNVAAGINWPGALFTRQIAMDFYALHGD